MVVVAVEAHAVLCFAIECTGAASIDNMWNLNQCL